MNKELPSARRRAVQILCSIAWCLMAAGPVFGFAALKPILINEGIYSEHCHFNDKDLESPETCVEQDLSLNFLFTVACMVTNISALPVGSILDSYGPQVTGIIGAVVIFIGSLFLKLGHLLTFMDAYLAGYTFLALGGPFVFISCFQLANSFPKNSGLILALLTGAFDSSSALFLVYRLVYTNVIEVPLSTFFTYFLAVPIFIFVCQVFVMPHDSYKTVGTLAKIAETAIDETGKPLNSDLLLPEDRNDESFIEPIYQPTITETTTLLMRSASSHRRESTISRASFASRASIKSVYEQEAEDKLFNSSGGVFGVMHGYTITEQLKSWWFILMALFTTIQMLRINYFVATIRSQEEYLYQSKETAIIVNHFFDAALPIGGLLSIPFIGLILDNLTTLTTLIILMVVSVTIGIMGILSWLPGTYFGIILMVLYRPFYYTAVSDFCAKVFGFETFGTVYGSIICFSGICNILQQVMDKVTHETFHMNPIPINSLLTALTIILGGILIQFVRVQERDLKRRNLELEAQEASIRGIPN
ncbi:hypothetical protein PSN45_004331 [Yamadazyma tenuis]|uniref:MFS general substrate transporter n=1 Tax=Candida tenuis (strain ATCC 10573 / BCRC 21748 / CBS 615 / JCM 9827 / NBRC 10315 / NRRL Y-1498 / VKM Y-70) TaxID=590646 RepID=G3B661_CANTC|nr:uncharacterized protein CANTEDRAFT_123591 [Yamadazyma tenuis ATCC 10573]EGV63389.1 hypothetical protein CANTEDRAFT_123591 [Yamadazyma tenuis ATCC 10573]WEJ96787.1 hypothetical protein PSN45_004331 [Yamadazyma tenuis]